MLFPSRVMHEKVKGCACNGSEWDKWVRQAGRSCWRQQTQAAPKFPVCQRAYGDSWNQGCGSVLQLNFWICLCTELGNMQHQLPATAPFTSAMKISSPPSFSSFLLPPSPPPLADVFLPVAGAGMFLVGVSSLEVLWPLSPSAPTSDPSALFSSLQDCGLCVRSFSCHCSAFPNTELADSVVLRNINP